MSVGAFLDVEKLSYRFTVGAPLPACPASAEHVLGAHPSATILFGALALLSLAFALVVGLWYNHVRVFNRKIRTKNISNTLWIVYYVCMTVRGAVNAVDLAIKADHVIFDDLMFVLSLVLHGVSAFALTLALNHQRRYRSSAPPPSHYGGAETDPLLAKVNWFRSNVGLTEALYFLILVVYLVFLIVQVLFAPREVTDILFVTAFGLQRLPILILVLIIVTNGHADGPSWESKAYLSVAGLLNVLGDLPLNIWARLLPGGCIFDVASLVDLIHLLFILSLIFFFLFLTREYRRNMEECIWSHVSQIQDTVGIGFKHF